MSSDLRSNLIRLRPRSDALHVSRGRIILSADRDGFFDGGTEKGLFAFETRLLSRYRWLIDGQSPNPVVVSNIDQHTWLGYYIQTAPGVDIGASYHGSGMMDPSSEYTLELRLSRAIGAALHETVQLTNHTQEAVSFELALELDADFADVKETKRNERHQHGKLERRWQQRPGGQWELAFDYRAEHDYDHQGHRGHATFHRGMVVLLERTASPPRFDAKHGRIVFDVALQPHQRWRSELCFEPRIDHDPEGDVAHAPRHGFEERERRTRLYLDQSTQFHAPGTDTLAPVVVATLERARQDLAALRLFDLDRDEHTWTLAAGLPIYAGLFGRDTLTASWEAALLGPEMLRGTLLELADWQGQHVDDWRDEQPGRMLHETHPGPLKLLHFNPNERNYSSTTTSAFYPVALAELWHWSGDRELVQRCLDPALRALEWADRYGDLDGDGIYEYQTRSEQGVKNQSWKDSPDAIVHEDGRQVATPIAVCEEQAFVYLAKLHMSELLWWFDRKDDAKRMLEQARALKQRFNDRFWLDDLGYLAMGLDSDKRPIRSIGSDAGHALAAAILDEERVQRVADRMLEPDLFSGWGVRTLSADHPAFDPFSYHRGSVWPVEHGTFALAFMRWGLWEHVHRICQAQFEAAALFDWFRLPELFSGHARTEEQPFPAFYPGANSPQAWSASAVMTMLQAMLGLYPYAPLHMLLVDPHLPEWLPEITLRGLRVGEARLDLRCWRDDDGDGHYRVERCEGPVHVVRQPSPWSLTAGPVERTVDLLKSLLPGH